MLLLLGRMLKGKASVVAQDRSHPGLAMIARDGPKMVAIGRAGAKCAFVGRHVLCIVLVVRVDCGGLSIVLAVTGTSWAAPEVVVT